MGRTHEFLTRRDNTKVGFYGYCACGDWQTHTTYTSWDKARSSWANHLMTIANVLEDNYSQMRADAEALVAQLDRPEVKRRLNIKAV